jgi:hypothetical protein
MFLFGGFALLLTIALCIHVVRTGREFFWLWIIILAQPIGGLVYLVAIVLPELLGGRTARRLGQATRQTLDPNRAYREAKASYDDSPTVANGMRLAQAAAGLGRHGEAEALFREAAQGVHADDPALLLGRANALIELGRFAEALPLLDALGQDADRGRTPQAALALGRAYEGLGRDGEADTAYEWATERQPGLEAISRYAAFLARTGRRDEARTMLAEIDRRIARANPTFRKEGRAWRALAAEALNT